MTPDPNKPPVLLQVHHIGMKDGYVLRWRHYTSGRCELQISPGTLGPNGTAEPYEFRVPDMDEYARYGIYPPTFYPTRGLVSPVVSKVGY